MQPLNERSYLSNAQAFFLAALRIVVGWHFLYEGLIKLFTSSWTATGYLMDSKGFMAPVFRSMAASPDVLRVVDTLNEWGLVLIGAALILGLFTRLASIAGMLLLLFYYLSHPPFIGLNYALPSEGSYFIVDKIVIEFFALGVVYIFRAGLFAGLDSLLSRNRITETE